MAPRRRLDSELVRRGLARSRREARLLIDAGKVTVGGAPADKVTRMVDPGEAVEVLGPGPPFVSRAGGKLAAALDAFGIEVDQARAIDVGSSTGGFTDCLLQRRAAHVVAVDVGTHQLHENLRGDPRVTSLEQTDIRSLDAASVGAPFDLVTVDLSFISLRTVLDPLLGLADERTELLVLIKPQFEAGRSEAARGRGVISDPDVWRRVLHQVADAIGDRGAVIMNLMVSPVRGARGNIEFVAHVRHDSGAVPIEPVRVDDVVDHAVALRGR